MINQIFKTKFSRVPERQHVAYYTSCEIQFDYFYSTPQFLAFISPCRDLELIPMEKILSISNVLFIHRSIGVKKGGKFLRNRTILIDSLR